MEKDREKLVEKMAKDIPFLTLDRDVYVSSDRMEKRSWTLSEEDNKLIAESLVVSGWTKLHKNSVVLSEDEYNDEFHLASRKAYDQGSKETAKEFIKGIMCVSSDPSWRENEKLVAFGKNVLDKLDELAHKFDTSVEEARAEIYLNSGVYY